MPIRKRTTAPAVPERPRSRAIVAAAASIGLDGASWRNWKLGDQRWQEEAWRHYDMAGGLRYAADWMGNALSQCRIYLAKRDENGEPGEEVTDPRLAIVARTMFGGPTQQAEALRTLGIQLYMVGESYIVAESVENAKKDIWYVISTSEIRRQGGRVLVDRSHIYGGGKYQLDPDKDLLIRVWTPHPRRHDAANSPVRAALPDLRELEQLRKKVFAQIDSRLAGAGLLFLPDELEFPNPDGDEALTGAAGLMKVIERAMAAALLDSADPAALVPIIVQVAAEFIDKIKWQTFETPFQAETLALRQEAIRALALALDQPAEILLGQGSANHWSAWQIEESTIKIQITPLGGRITDALYTAYGQVALTILKEDPDEYTFGFDTSGLVIRPDRQADALALEGRLSDEAVRKAGNWSEDDAPKPDEQERKLATQLVLAQPELISNKDIQRALGISWTIDPPALPPGVPGAPGQPDVPQPRRLPTQPSSTETPAQEAALLVGADLIVHRALERAGNRLLTSKRRGQFAGVPPCELHEHIEVTAGDAGRLTAEAWEPARLLALRIGMEPGVVTDMLRTYTEALIVHGEAHDYDRFALYVSQALDLIGHADCTQFCRNPLHPGPCRGWRRQLDVAPDQRRDIAEEPRQRRRRAADAGPDVGAGRRRAPDTGSDREAEVRPEPNRKLKPGLDPKKDMKDAMAAAAAGGDYWDESDPAYNRVREAMIAAYYLNDQESGLRTDIQGFQMTSEGRAFLRITILDRQGYTVGTSNRQWRLHPDGRLTAYHAFLRLNTDVQGGGFSQRYNANAEEVYRDAGVAWIDIHADLDVGGYTWASQGYDFASQVSLNTVVALFRARAQDLVPQSPVRQEIEALLARSTAANFQAGTHPTPYEFAMAGRSAARKIRKNGREILMWPGKRYMLGSDWIGRKPVTEQVRQLPAQAPQAGGRNRAVTAAIRSWDDRAELLAAVATASLEHANVFGQTVPAYPEDATPTTNGETDYAEHHHLISAGPEVDQYLIDDATEFLGPDVVTAAAETETFHLPGRHDQKTHGHRRGQVRRSSVEGVGPFTEEEVRTRGRQRRSRVDPDREAGAPQRQGRRMMREWTGEADRLNRLNQAEREQYQREGSRRAVLGSAASDAGADRVRERPRPAQPDERQREWESRVRVLRAQNEEYVRRILAAGADPDREITQREAEESARRVRADLPGQIERERVQFFGGNPRILTGNSYGHHWHKGLNEDTGWDAPIKVDNLAAGSSSYKVRSGLAFRVDGVGYLVEGPISEADARTIAKGIAEIHKKQLPADATQYQKAYTWARGANPGDAYWQQRFNNPSHRADASAGGGQVTFWGRAAWRRPNTNPRVPSGEAWAIVHEYGHSFDYGQEGRYGRYTVPVISNGIDWAVTALDRDRIYNGGAPGRVWTFSQDDTRSRFPITFTPGSANQNAEVPTGVTTYGQSSLQEDFAESLALYRNGALGRGTFQDRQGVQTDIYFRDLFPGRAAVLDKYFPDVAARQRAEIEAKRATG